MMTESSLLDHLIPPSGTVMGEGVVGEGVVGKGVVGKGKGWVTVQEVGV